MLKGDVFKNQIFENHVFALFINLFMNSADGVARTYKNAMNITYSGHNVTIDKGACIVQGRLLEEDSSTIVDAGIETMFCKLVVEVDLDKTNTSSVFNQGYYNVVKSANGWPNLTQQDIAGQNSGKYQYELARFKISDGVVTEFQDKRTYIEDLLQYGEIENLDSRLTEQYYNKNMVDSLLEGNAWTNISSTHSSISSSNIKIKKIGNIVQLYGTATINDANYQRESSIASLPTGYRPGRTMNFFCSAGGIATYNLILNTSGNILATNYNDINNHNPQKFPSGTTLILNATFMIG